MTRNSDAEMDLGGTDDGVVDSNYSTSHGATDGVQPPIQQKAENK